VGATRDRHGRGLRGRLLPPEVTIGDRTLPLPAWRSSTDRFDDAVRDAFGEIEQHWAQELAQVVLAVEDVPPSFAPGSAGLVTDDTEGGAVPLAIAVPADHARPARLVVYRRPVEARVEGLGDLVALLHDVLVDAVAELLGRDPDDIDPS